MKDKSDPDLMAYLRSEREFYDREVNGLVPVADQLREEMVGRVAAAEESARWRDGGHTYFTRTVAGAEFEQFCRVDDSGVEQLLLDENTLLDGSTYVSVGVRLVSPDGRYLAYSVDTAGDEVFELRFRDLATMTDLPDTVAHTYYSGAWSADSGSFFYVVHDDIYRPFQVWRHTLGTDATSDSLVFEDLDPQYDVVVWADRAGDYVVIHTTSRTTSEVHLIDAHDPGANTRCVAPRRAGVEYSVGHLPVGEGSLLIVTNEGAQEFRLMRASLAQADLSVWREVAPERADERLHGVEVFRGHVVLETVSRGRQLLRLLPWQALDDVDPFEQSIVVDAGVPGGLLTLWHNEEFASDSVLVEVESYAVPPEWQEISLTTGERSVIRRQVVPGYHADDYVLEDRWVTARDGEQVPVRLVRRSTTELDGTAPLLLYGYGAYESSFWPGFETWLPSLLDRGMVFAHAGIRGGAEMGRRWWLDGCMANKVNTFLDFINVADSLADDGLIDGSRIVSRGLSAGGLLQGVVFSQRPDRWRAVVAEVPFVDVVNSMLDVNLPLTAGEHDEWGDPRVRAQFDVMVSYSPYDNIPSGATPDLLVTGAFHDPRVMVHEPAKWVAALREKSSDRQGRVLLRVETGEGGHSGPTGRYAHLAYEAEVAAFILDAVGEAR
jgi:oligopeptidase B